MGVQVEIVVDGENLPQGNYQLTFTDIALTNTVGEKTIALTNEGVTWKDLF